MHQAVEDGVGECRVADRGMPMLDLQLTGDDRRAGAVPVIEDLQEIAAALVGQRGECPFVDDEHLGFRELGQRLEVAAIAASDGQSRQESSQTHIENGVALPARLIGESAGEIGLADALSLIHI